MISPEQMMCTKEEATSTKYREFRMRAYKKQCCQLSQAAAYVKYISQNKHRFMIIIY